MVVTRVTTNSITPQESGVCGEFTIVLDNSLCIHKVKVINGEKGYFISFPNIGGAKNMPDGKRFFDVVHPTNNELRQDIQSKVLEQYFNEVDKNK